MSKWQSSNAYSLIVKAKLIFKTSLLSRFWILFAFSLILHLQVLLLIASDSPSSVLIDIADPGTAPLFLDFFLWLLYISPFSVLLVVFCLAELVYFFWRPPWNLMSDKWGTKNGLIGCSSFFWNHLHTPLCFSHSTLSQMTMTKRICTHSLRVSLSMWAYSVSLSSRG